jgi:dihydrofolate reductase
MSKIVVFTSLTLDGVMQAPGRPDEDRRGEFRHGGWATPYADEVSGRLAGEGMATTGSLLLGRRTYEDILAHWNSAGGPFKDMLNDTPKHVVSTTLSEPLPWPNSTLIQGHVAEACANLRKARKDVLVLGSRELVQTLLEHDLVDRFILLIHPLVLGSGRRLFNDGGPMAKFELVDAKTSTTGIIIATYRRADRA